MHGLEESFRKTGCCGNSSSTGREAFCGIIACDVLSEEPGRAIRIEERVECDQVCFFPYAPLVLVFLNRCRGRRIVLRAQHIGRTERTPHRRVNLGLGGLSPGYICSWARQYIVEIIATHLSLNANHLPKVLPATVNRGDIEPFVTFPKTLTRLRCRPFAYAVK